MEKFEQGCWYKKVYDDPNIGFYDVFKVREHVVNKLEKSEFIDHSCFYRLYYDGRYNYYKQGTCNINETITKVCSTFIKDILETAHDSGHIKHWEN